MCCFDEECCKTGKAQALKFPVDSEKQQGLGFMTYTIPGLTRSLHDPS